MFGAGPFLKGEREMEFFNSAVTVLQTLVVALGAGLGIWGVINLLEGNWQIVHQRYGRYFYILSCYRSISDRKRLKM